MLTDEDIAELEATYLWRKRTPRYERASEALAAAHAACFQHKDRDALGMSRGPFSGVNEALGIIVELEIANAGLRVRLDQIEREHAQGASK